MKSQRLIGILLGALVSIAALAPVRANSPTLRFQVFARTTIRLTDIVWTGKRFLYVDNTTNRVSAAGPTGTPARPFAAMPRQVEETRCAVSPGGHGFPAGALYCHSPDNKIYRISAGGKRVSVFAALPRLSRSDGALAFDTVGRFGYRLLAATGRSGSAKSQTSAVFAVDRHGTVQRIGGYPGLGGADEIAVAPARFGSISGDALLAVDAGKSGALVAMGPNGRARRLLRLPDGPNPIVTLTASTPIPGAAQRGLYVADTLSRTVYFAPAADLNRYPGTILIGSELRGLFWVLRPRGDGVTALRLSTNLDNPHYNLEAAVYLG